jgi:pyruvate dehydrogenase E2 component (dihydrolipoamide acetyltransferase)
MMPDLSTLDFTMEEGRIVEWFKKEGEPVQKGEPILEIETAKVTMEIEAPATGVLTRILVPQDDEVSPGTVLAVIE